MSHTLKAAISQKFENKFCQSVQKRKKRKKKKEKRIRKAIAKRFALRKNAIMNLLKTLSRETNEDDYKCKRKFFQNRATYSFIKVELSLQSYSDNDNHISHFFEIFKFNYNRKKYLQRYNPSDIFSLTVPAVTTSRNHYLIHMRNEMTKLASMGLNSQFNAFL